MMENDVGRVTDDPRVEKLAERIKRLGDVRLPLEVRLELGEIYADVRTLSILDNERIATRSDVRAVASATSRNASSDDVALAALSRKAAAWQKLGGKPSEDDVFAEALCMAEREIIGLRAALATPSNEALLREALEALRPFAESIVIDPTKQRGERHWATCGKLTNFEDQLRAHNTVAKIDAALNPPGVE